jgi:hypothetical protein
VRLARSLIARHAAAGHAQQAMRSAFLPTPG